ncbi:hypothetical protein B5F35_12330 [Anaeromassilibacillus sp. An200]|nr:hypothetical protein B5F35_12330 [Anaeromassilibacillus sp. An200]
MFKHSFILNMGAVMTYFYVPYYTMRVYAFQEISPQILLFVKKETIHFPLLRFLCSKGAGAA